MTLSDTIGPDTRLKAPMRRRLKGGFEETSWESVLTEVASDFQRIKNEHGPDSIAFYLSGQLLTEDYYVANKLMKGFIGSANVDTNSRLCMASAVAGHRRAFGADTVPGCYEDIDLANLIVIVGSNTAWCHPILFQRILNRRKQGAKIIVIDTRRTITAESADLFLQILPGSDQALFSGLLVYLAECGALDKQFIANHTVDFDAALIDRKSTRLNSSHTDISRMPSSA